MGTAETRFARLRDAPTAAALSVCAAGAWALRARMEILAILCLALGWGLPTWGIASLLGVWQVWPISAGLLFLCLFGLGFFRDLAREGLYATMKAAEAEERRRRG